jgi:hypothetical protein
MAQVKDTNSFIIKANKLHNNKYNYDKTKYINAKSHVIITCPKHGDFYQAPTNHLNSPGCSKCGYEVTSLKLKHPKPGRSFKDKFPNLIKNWSSKNQKGPDEYSHQSGQRIWWLCDKCGYESYRLLTDATRGGCVSCSGKILTSKNRLSTLFPNLVKEWDFTKNQLSPNNINIGSHQKVWWICSKCQYSWQANISNRARLKNSSGCTKCNRSKGENKTESLLKQYNISYQTQYRIKECRYINQLIFDFAIWQDNKLRLIEFNGKQHYMICSGFYSCKKQLKIRQKRDKIKFKFCTKNNIPLLIIPYYEFDNIETLILEFLERNK